MSLKIGIVMDPIERIKIVKDSSFAMLLSAQSRGHSLFYMEVPGLYITDGVAMARMQSLQVEDNSSNWFQLGEVAKTPLAELDVILMRKDPPFDMDFVYSTLILDLAEKAGVLVVNKPQSLRDANEKLFTTWFPQCCVPMLVSRDVNDIRAFVDAHGKSVVKPLDGMGGHSIFQLNRGDPNLNVILETMSGEQGELMQVQRYIKEITAGDKRILMINGKPIDYALARIPGADDFRGNLAAGGRGVGVPLSDRDRWIAAELGPELKKRGILFAGIDVIGDYLTEVNVTSPTCIRELDAEYGLDIAAQLFAEIENQLGRS
ncbi:MAG: glutathione synthase [Xanthomonadales bacterium]|nr:glutathione synthase [Xanthomonadales bacterium]